MAPKTDDGTHWILHILAPFYCQIYPQYKGKFPENSSVLRERKFFGYFCGLVVVVVVVVLRFNVGNYLNQRSRATAVWGISQLLFSVETQLISLPCRLKQCIVKTPTMYFSLKEEKWTFCLIISGMNIYFSSGPFCHKCKTLQVVQSCVDRVGFSQHWILFWRNFLLGENIGRILLLPIFRKNWIETKLMLDKLTKEKGSPENSNSINIVQP